MCSLPRADLWDAVSRGQVRGGQASETSGETEEEPAGRPGELPSHTGTSTEGHVRGTCTLITLSSSTPHL